MNLKNCTLRGMPPNAGSFAATFFTHFGAYDSSGSPVALLYNAGILIPPSSAFSKFFKIVSNGAYALISKIIFPSSPAYDFSAAWNKSPLINNKIAFAICRSYMQYEKTARNGSFILLLK